MSSLETRHRFTISNIATNEKETNGIYPETAQDTGMMNFSDDEEQEKELNSETDQFDCMMIPGDEEQ